MEPHLKNSLSKSKTYWFAIPTIGWMIWFLVIPLIIVFIYSFLTKGIYGGIVYRSTLENYSRAFDWLYFGIFFQSVKLALFTAIFCLLIGYPMAYALATASQKLRPVLLTLLVVPFWTNFVVRTYALKVMFADQGPINSLALSLGLIDAPITLSNSYAMVWLGMVTNYLPYMVLPLYVTLEKFDFSLLEAGRDLGASGWNNFWKVLIPLTKHGIVTGSILVFTPALGEFLIPDLLGGAKTMLMGNLITEQFLKMRDWPFGSALSMVLMAVVLASLVVIIRLWMKESEASSSETMRDAA
ncbi:MAG: Spermidine/putrescine transporter permease [Bacteriovoracaceae bacterium]|nr:Spermidine/putrescine transporter permease [Bacteriovoracaceae bacterium]